MRQMRVEFDPHKASANFQKHGVRFAEAADCLLDPLALVREDLASEGEARFVLVGSTPEGRILTVCYAYRGKDSIRLISARRATHKERFQYAQGV